MAPNHSKPVGDDNNEKKKRARRIDPLFDLLEDTASNKIERGEAVFKDDVVDALAEGKELKTTDLAKMIEPVDTPPKKVAAKPLYDLKCYKDADAAKENLSLNPDGHEEWLKMTVGEVESPPRKGSCTKCGRFPCIIDVKETREYGSAIVEAYNSQALAGEDVEVNNLRFELYKMHAHALGCYKKRKELPACVIEFIRKEFPAEDGKCVGFKERSDSECLSM